MDDSFWGNLGINLLSAVIGAIIGCLGTLYLDNRKERTLAKARFKNRLNSLAHELRMNYRYVGNYENPFLTKALENLVYNEPLIHEDQQLFEKAQKCLSTAQILSSSKNPQQKPSDGQHLMADLAEFIKKKYKIVQSDF